MKIFVNFYRVEKEGFLCKGNRVLVKVCNVCEIFFLIILNEFLQFDREENQVHQYAGIHPY